MKNLKRILLIEDDSRNIELIIAALSKHNLADEVTLTRHGVEALSSLYRRGAFTQFLRANAVVILLDLNGQFCHQN